MKFRLVESKNKTYFNSDVEKSIAKHYYPNYHWEVIDINNLIDKQGILKDNSVLNRRQQHWGNSYDDYQFKYWKMEPIRLTYDHRIADGNHRIVALRNAGYTNAEVLVPNESVTEAFLDDNEEFFDYETADVEGQDIFDTHQGESSFTRSFLNPEDLEYRQKYKNQTAKIVQMSPEEYYKICADRFGCTVDKLKTERGEYDKHIIDKLTQVINKYHKKFPIAYIDYTTHAGQEGLHRMFVAGKLFGWDTKFPVLIIDWLDKDKHEKEEKQYQESLIRDRIRSAINDAMYYRYSNIDEFFDEMQWTLNRRFNDRLEDDDVEFSRDEEDDIGYITVDGVTAEFNLSDINISDDLDSVTEEYDNPDLEERKEAEEKAQKQKEQEPHQIQMMFDKDGKYLGLKENYQPFTLEKEKNRIRDVLDIMKDIEYGFISKIDGEKITDRDWIHNCDLNKYYEVNTDPKVTLNNKLGICQDQSILVKYLMNKYHPEDEVVIYTMTKSPKGHCVPCYCHNNKWYYLENAWDKEKGLHGYFDSEDELKKYLEFVYYENHKDDTPKDSEVVVEPYEMPLQESVSEDEVKKFLSNLKTTNKRYDYSQFEKLFNSGRVWETFENKALAALVKNKLKLNDYYLNEIQSFEKGGGAKLLKKLITKYDNLWFLSDPNSDNSLKQYYRQFGFKEINLDDSIWNKPITLFYKGDDRLKQAIIKNYKK